MRVARGVVIGVGWGMLVLPCVPIRAQSALPSPTGPARTAAAHAEQAADGTTPYGTPETDGEGVLRGMADRAAVIFVGTVTAVQKGTDDDLRGSVASSVIEVDFAVEHAIKGATVGSVYALREWAGLWRDRPRFAVGQRLLLLLHAAGPGGLSSPVDGLDGAIPIKATEALNALAAQAVRASAADAPQTAAAPDDAVDMRWLQARTLRVQTFADEPTASPGVSSPNGFALEAPQARAMGAMPEAAPAAGLKHVLGLLMSWRESGNVSR